MALSIVSKLKDAMVKFCIGLFSLRLIMEFGLGWVLGKDLLLMVSSPCLNAPGVPPLDLMALTYQCIALRMPNFAPVCLCLW